MRASSLLVVVLIHMVQALLTGCQAPASKTTTDTAYVHRFHAATQPHDTVSDTTVTPADSALLERQRLDLVRSQLKATDYIDTVITDQNADSLAREEIHYTVRNGKVLYAPHKRFKLFNYEEEHCGATCFSNWLSYVHFEYNHQKVVREMETMAVDHIYQLPDGKYLLFESGFEHPISAYYAECKAARIISLAKGQIRTHPIRYRRQQELYLRHDNDAQPNVKAFIAYDPKRHVISYQYISNRSYLAGRPNIDSLRIGQLHYVNGQFVLIMSARSRPGTVSSR